MGPSTTDGVMLVADSDREHSPYARRFKKKHPSTRIYGNALFIATSSFFICFRK